MNLSFAFLRPNATFLRPKFGGRLATLKFGSLQYVLLRVCHFWVSFFDPKIGVKNEAQNSEILVPLFELKQPLFKIRRYGFAKRAGRNVTT